MSGEDKTIFRGMTFRQARAMARVLCADDQDEYSDLRGRGAYALPLSPEAVWSSEWSGWDDWLGVKLPYKEAKGMVRRLGVQSPEHYALLREQGAELQQVGSERWNSNHALKLRDVGGSDGNWPRLPADPAWAYGGEWAGWDSFLGSGKSGNSGGFSEQAEKAMPVASGSVPDSTASSVLRLRGTGIERLCVLASAADFTTQLPDGLHFHPTGGAWVDSEQKKLDGEEELSVAVPHAQLEAWPAMAGFA
eukprot:CAMPEP_0171683924 /NCGR_PEP_ID=MMETSP0991-20121206/1384_1 /TAXON_ID=483369 /ORGANISM="non described non described, Strain CCMP2098" /LENGTH=248 /DNA_ID=CAMNT_0012271357 /DNA_START=87 /DNA_END=829 /DNA_ORIENTATION=+